MNYLEKNEISVDNLKKYHKEFIKNNKIILKTQQRFKSEMHNIFTAEIVQKSSNVAKTNISIRNEQRSSK